GLVGVAMRQPVAIQFGVGEGGVVPNGLRRRLGTGSFAFGSSCPSLHLPPSHCPAPHQDSKQHYKQCSSVAPTSRRVHVSTCASPKSHNARALSPFPYTLRVFSCVACIQDRPAKRPLHDLSAAAECSPRAPVEQCQVALAGGVSHKPGM